MEYVITLQCLLTGMKGSETAVELPHSKPAVSSLQVRKLRRKRTGILARIR